MKLMTASQLHTIIILFFISLSATSGPARYASVTDDGKAAVASVNPLATTAGLNAILAGGNAIDAAVAVAYTLGVVDSQNSGIGGGCFALIRWADGTIEAIDGREMAPALAHRDMFVKNGVIDKKASKVGPLAIGIPGSVALLDYIQRKGGKLNAAKVILPAANLAARGFPVDKAFASRLSRTAEAMKAFPSSASIFLKSNGTALQAGNTLVQQDLAATYRNIASQGPKYFYEAGFAKAVDKWMRAQKGFVRYEDFTRYRILQRQPVVSTFMGYTIYGFPPPSSGGVHVAQILNILDNYPLAKMKEGERYHVLAEAMKLAFADRAWWLGDPDYVKVPKGLVDADYAKSLSKRIRLDKTTAVKGHTTPPNSDSDFFKQLNKHTTHISTADKYGNWVAITTTVNTSFGSKVVIPGTGVVMNNQMDDFSAKEGVPNSFNLVGAYANSVQAGKRPLSSMSPTIVMKNGQPIMTLGAAGGPTIINQVVQTLVNYLAMKMPLQAAVAKDRIHHQWKPDRITAENSLPENTRKTLEDLGHEVNIWRTFGATQAIALENKVFAATSEPRIIAKNR